ncbi:MAG: DUF2088 domain-containing protein [Deltaproteobacteria bacterium]|nr:DUF2088 domain-containing protein [Deltaproteobacteria bacterium]
MRRPTLLSGLDLLAPKLPGDASLLALPPPVRPLPNPEAAVRAAIDHPVAGRPLAERVTARSKVLIVVEHPAHLVPAGELRPLRLALHAVLDVLKARGLPLRAVKILVACGLEHRPAMTELAPALGLEVTGGYEVDIFDAEAHRAFRDQPDGANGAQELAQALAEADLIVDLSVRTHAPRPPLANLVEGLATYRALRPLHRPEQNPEPIALQRAKALAAELPIFSVALVQSEAVLSAAAQGLLGTSDGLSASARAWNRMPQLMRRRAAALFRSAAAPGAVFAGDPLAAESQADDAVRAATRVPHGPPVDILVIGVPDLSPDAPDARPNPVLTAHLGLVTLLGQVRHRLRDGGAVVLATPLGDQFNRVQHLPYVEFYERALRVAPRGIDLSQRFEFDFSGRPELVAAYQKRGAVHGAHPFHRWYAQERARAGLRVFAAGAGAAAAQRVGFEPAATVEAGLEQARDVLGLAQPQVGVLDVLGLAR